MPKECIILAGGLGTRLRDAVPDLPKCMAPVAQQPFLKHVIRYLLSQGVEKFIFSLGYRHEIIEAFLKEEFPTINYDVVVEAEPLGTGGAIHLACKRASEENVVVLNGDTIFRTDINLAFEQHLKTNAACTMLLKRMQNFDRYGVVSLNEDGIVTRFHEKQHFTEGNINAGVYVLNVNRFLNKPWPQQFSFEKDYLEKCYAENNIYGIVADAYFIDIGIPTDFAKAQIELKQTPLQLENIDPSWTLFLDRDGVINLEKEEDYILSWSEFEFYPRVTEAIGIFAKKFDKIIVVSNQRGVGRGLMTEDALLDIQHRMKSAIEFHQGRIDKIYYCTATDARDFCRKPNPGMALQARKDVPSIDFAKTIMTGNKMSDMRFGRNAGTHTIYLKTTHPSQPIPHPDIDLTFNSLIDFAKAL